MKKKNRVTHPIAHADGGEREGLVRNISNTSIDTSKLNADKLKLLSDKLTTLQALRGKKNTVPNIKIQTAQYTLLPLYMYLGKGNQADLTEFGKQVILKWVKKNDWNAWTLINPAVFITERLLVHPIKLLKAKIKGEPESLFDYRESCEFGHGTGNAFKAWKTFSTKYYDGGNNTLIVNMYDRFNSYFQVDFMKVIKELHLQQEAAKIEKEKAKYITDPQQKAEAESKAQAAMEAAQKAQKDYMNYLSSTWIDEVITSVVREGEENKQLIKDCIRTYIENPKEVMRYQFEYYNNKVRQEGADAKAMKNYGYGRQEGKADEIINNCYNTLNTGNEKIYDEAKKFYMPKYNLPQVLHINVTEASKWLENMAALPVSVDLSNYYTENVATSDINSTELQYGRGDNKDTKSNISIILVGGAALVGLYLFKKSKR